MTADLRPQKLLEGRKQTEESGELKNLKTKCLLRMSVKEANLQIRTPASFKIWRYEFGDVETH